MLSLVFVLVSTVFSVLQDPDFKFIPQFKGALIPPSNLEWSGSCFKSFSAHFLHFDQNGAQFQVVAKDKIDHLCAQSVIFATPDGIKYHLFEFTGTHTITVDHWKDSDEYQFVHDQGFQVFEIPPDILKDLYSFYETYEMLTKKYDPAAVQEFVTQTMHYPMPQRDNILASYAMNNSNFHPGDNLVISEMNQATVLVMFGTGGVSGHTAIFLNLDGVLSVCESVASTNFRTPYGVRCTPWNVWREGAYKANVNVVHQPLSKKNRKIFNNTAAVARFKELQGINYGFVNFVYGWLDTKYNNFPPPVNCSTFYALPLWDKVTKPNKFGPNELLYEGLRHRVPQASHCQNSTCFFQVFDQLQTSFCKVITQVEEAHWTYTWMNSTNKEASVCSVFSARMLKAGGIFDGIEFQPTELTPRDVYQLDIWGEADMLTDGCLYDKTVTPKYCQMMGGYWLSYWIDQPNSIPVHDHMFNSCPGLYPKYVHSKTC